MIAVFSENDGWIDSISVEQKLGAFRFVINSETGSKSEIMLDMGRASLLADTIKLMINNYKCTYHQNKPQKNTD